MKMTAENMETVNYKVNDNVGIITLNRPKQLNAINEKMTEEVWSSLDKAEKDPNVRTVFLTGVGGNFSSGADLIEGFELYHSMGEEPSEAYREHYETYLNVSLKIWGLKKPVIAVIDGYALGAAADWVFSADVAIASENAQIGEPEIRFASAPPTLMMPWIVGLRKSKELLMTGDIIDAQEAHRLNIFNKVVPKEKLMDEAYIMAEKMAKIPESALKITKVTINKIYEMLNIKESLDFNVETAIAMFFLNREEDYGKIREEIKEIGLGEFLKKYN